MRLGLIVYDSLDGISGGYLYDRQVVKYLTGAGDSIEVFSLPRRAYGRDLAQNVAPALRRIASLPLDVLLQDELCHPSLFLFNRWRRGRAPFPVIAIIHNLSLELRPGALRRRIEKMYLDSVDGFIFTSPAAQRSVESLTDSPKPFVLATSSGDHLGAGTEEKTIAGRALEPGPLRLVFVGGIAPHKGIHTLLEALTKLPLNAVRLNVIGPVRDRDYARRLQRQVNGEFATGVEWVGPLFGEALADRLRRSHVFVLPSSYEAYPIACIEAMAFGLVPIVTSQGGAADLLVHGESGFLVPPGDGESLAGYIGTLGADRSRLASMGLSARRAYLSLPAWSATVSRVRAFFEELIDTYSLRFSLL